MAKYYPKSQIKTNLYTNGNEYVTENDFKNYIGPYYEVYTGDKFVGESPSSTRNIIRLISTDPSLDSLQDNSQDIPIKIRVLSKQDIDIPYSYLSPNSYLNNSTYSTLSSLSVNRYVPLSSITLPTEQDYKNKRMIRYFAKKTTKLVYLEISKQTFTDLNSRSSTIAWDLYEPVQIYWIISDSSKQQANKYNTIIVRDIEQKKKWYGFSKFLKEDYTKYYKNLSS